MNNAGFQQQNTTSTKEKKIKNKKSKQPNKQVMISGSFFQTFISVFRAVMDDNHLHFTTAPDNKRGRRREKRQQEEREGSKGTGPRPL